MPNNQEFLAALFGADAPWVHVTDFQHDPDNIPSDQHMRCWAGDYFSRHTFQPNSNQYFTISNFGADENGRARRRKVLYRHTPVIVLDDVKEKLAMEEVEKLPKPTWILETSAGSEQWGYLLNEPCTDRAKVENLLDGLVANGLAPDGRDPGMKGVTRYVRLPDGYNTKAKRYIDGKPFKCHMLTWEPFNRVTLEQLAEPFHVDLTAVRRDSRVDGASAISDHPLVNIPDIIHIKEVRSDGRFDITCPWVDEHTGEIDNGTGIFTNGDGTIGFKCHHGACQDRTGADLLRYINTESSSFTNTLNNWQATRQFSKLVDSQATTVPTIAPPPPVSNTTPPAPPVAAVEETIDTVGEAAQVALATLRAEPPFSPKARIMASEFLKVVDPMPEIERVYWHQQVRDTMRWSKQEFVSVLQDLRETWYTKDLSEISFFDEVVYVGELNQFFDRRKRIFYNPDAFQNSYAHLDAEARKEALQGGRVTKVDRVDYAPKKPPTFEERGVMYANAWHNSAEPLGVPGDVQRWLDHWDALGWADHRDHMLKWMAWTIRHPDIKINHMLLLGSAEGCGKDFLLYPLIQAMGDHQLTIPGEALIEGFNEYLLSTKYLHINEVELADHSDAKSISNKLKPIAAAPPDKLRINQKGIKAVYVRNIVSASMCTNSTLPFKTHGISRRIFGVWSDLNVRDLKQNMLQSWRVYWQDRWTWMKDGGGADACVHYLRNNVDLSNFNPAEAPPVTQFLRDINDSSKPLLQQTIEYMCTGGAAVFKSDIFTAFDLNVAIRRGTTAMQDDNIYVDVRFLSPAKIVNVLSDIPEIKRRDVSNEDGVRKYWIARNHDYYMSMPDEEFLKAYGTQINIARFGDAGSNVSHIGS